MGLQWTQDRFAVDAVWVCSGLKIGFKGRAEESDVGIGG